MELVNKLYKLEQDCRKEEVLYINLKEDLKRFGNNHIRKESRLDFLFGSTEEIEFKDKLQELDNIIAAIGTRRKNLYNTFLHLRKNCKHDFKFDYTDYHKNEDYYTCIHCNVTH